MICSHCGFQCAEGAAYCPCCGAALQASPQPQPQPSYGYVPRHPVIEAVRSVATSTLFLVAVIAFTVALVFSILGTGESTSAMYDMLGELSMDMDMGEFMPEYTSTAYSVGSVIGGVFGSIPTILLVVGLWMIYGAAKKNEPTMATGGLTLVWVMQIISLVGVCILTGLLALVLLIVFLIGGLSVADIPDMEGTIALVVIAILAAVLAAVMALVIVYQVKVMKMVNAARQTLTTGIPSEKISTLVVVFCFVSGGFSALSALGSLVSLSVMTALSTAASAVASILFAVVAIQYRDTMRRLMTPAPVAPPTPYVQAGQVYGTPYAGVPTPPVGYTDPYATAELDPIPEQPDETPNE